MSSSNNLPIVTIPNRPFSTETITGLMLPDGIFESTLGNQQINAHFRNQDASPINATIYVESASDPRFAITPQTYNVNLLSKASHLLSWDVDISLVPPGVYLISFIAQIDTRVVRIIKKVFVTRVHFDSSSKTFSAKTPEGIVAVRFMDLFTPKTPCCGGSRPQIITDERQSFGELFNRVSRLFAGHDTEFHFCPPGYLPHDVEIVVVPTPIFSGQYGDLPFQDPWWKLFLLLIAALLAIAGAIVNAVTGGGQDPSTVTVGTTEKSTCCAVQADGGSSNYAAAGLYGAAAAVATAAAASDMRDPFRRGQDNTLPATGELTTSERLNLSIGYPEPVALGKPFAVDAKWEYTRFTTGATYNYSITETNHNVHTLSHYQITAPNVVRVYREEPFIVQGEFYDQDGTLLQGDQLFVRCILAGPQGQYRSFVMQDNGIYPDQQPGDGIYTGGIRFISEDHGFWMIYVIAQDINTAQPDMTPEQAAQIIGGFVRTHQLTVTFSGGTCPLVPDGEVHVLSSLGS